MAPLSGPTYRVTCRGTIFDQDWSNVFFFVATVDVSPSAADLAAAFAGLYMPAIQTIESIAVEWQFIDVDAVLGAVDFFSLGVESEAGDISGDCLPPYAAWAYKYVRADRTQRHGYKRFPGVPEIWQNNGEITAGAATTAALALATVLNSPLIGSSGSSYQPAVQQRTRNKITLVPPNYNAPATVVFQNISTQNSRKFGRG